jgi:hypothetical protein
MLTNEAEVIDLRQRLHVRRPSAQVIDYRPTARAADAEYVDLGRHAVAVLGALFFAMAGLATGAWLQI